MKNMHGFTRSCNGFWNARLNTVRGTIWVKIQPNSRNGRRVWVATYSKDGEPDTWAWLTEAHTLKKCMDKVTWGPAPVPLK